VIRKASEVNEVFDYRICAGAKGTGEAASIFQDRRILHAFGGLQRHYHGSRGDRGFSQARGIRRGLLDFGGPGQKFCDDGQVAELGPGDALLTLDQHSHSIENAGTTPLKLLAVLSNQVKK